MDTITPPSCYLLKIKVHSGCKLAKKDIFGLSDPYVKVTYHQIVAQNRLKIVNQIQTPTIKRNLNPVWDIDMVFNVTTPLDSSYLLFEVFDENRITRDDFLGQVRIHLADPNIKIIRDDVESEFISPPPPPPPTTSGTTHSIAPTPRLPKYVSAWWEERIAPAANAIDHSPSGTTDPTGVGYRKIIYYYDVASLPDIGSVVELGLRKRSPLSRVRGHLRVGLTLIAVPPHSILSFPLVKSHGDGAAAFNVAFAAPNTEAVGSGAPTTLTRANAAGTGGTDDRHDLQGCEDGVEPNIRRALLTFAGSDMADDAEGGGEGRPRPTLIVCPAADNGGGLPVGSCRANSPLGKCTISLGYRVEGRRPDPVGVEDGSIATNGTTATPVSGSPYSIEGGAIRDDTVTNGLDSFVNPTFGIPEGESFQPRDSSQYPYHTTSLGNTVAPGDGTRDEASGAAGAGTVSGDETNGDSDDPDPLPPGWECRQDANGRTFYICHLERRTQWERPSTSNQKRIALNHREEVERIRKLYNRRRHISVDYSSTSADDDQMSLASSLAGNSATRSIPSQQPGAATDSVSVGGSIHSAGNYGDGNRARARFSRAHSIDQSLMTNFSQQTTPASAASDIWEEPPPSVAATSDEAAATAATLEDPGPLPAGWDTQRASNGRSFFIDHNRKLTTWIDPRTLRPTPPPAPAAFAKPPTDIRTSANPDSASTGAADSTLDAASSPADVTAEHEATPTAVTDGSALAKLKVGEGWPPKKRSAQHHHHSKHGPNYNVDDLGPLPDGWEERIHVDGRIFYIDHKTRSTQWEDPRLNIPIVAGQAVPYSRDYKRKYEYFKTCLPKPKTHGHHHHHNSSNASGASNNAPVNKIEIKVSRERVLEDSFRIVMSLKPDYLKNKLWVQFQGEAVMDYGGAAREWFFLLSHEMFNPYYGLFEYSAVDNYTLQINPHSGILCPQHLSYFKFVGRISGMAVYHGKLLDAFFIRPFYRMMIHKHITVKDMESVDSEYYNSLCWIRDNDPKNLDLTFAVDESFLGETQHHELKPGGAGIAVTNDNKLEYIDLVIKWRFVSRILPQMHSFMEGFNEFIPSHLLKIFDENEIELLLCGLGDIDVKDWRENTIYKGEYHQNHIGIQWFWRIVLSMNNEIRARLLQFVTGTSRVPMNGFKELYGSNGLQKFCIEKWGTTQNYPRAHTCFNRLDLPFYNSYEEMKSKLVAALENAKGFGGVD